MARELTARTTIGRFWGRVMQGASGRRGDDAEHPSARQWLNATLSSIALIAIVSLAIELLYDHAPVRSLIVLYLLAVVPVAVLWGVVFATAVSVVSVLLFSFLFLEPRWQLHITQAGDWYALFVFLITAVVVSELAARSQRAARASARLAEEQGALRRVATLVAGQTTTREQLDALISEEVARLLSADLALMRHFEDDGGVRLMGQWARSPGIVGTELPPAVRRASERVALTREPTRVETRTSGASSGEDGELSSAVGAPIIVEGRLWGAMIVASRANVLPPNAEERLADFTALVAIAIANAKNRAELSASRQRVVVAADQTRRRIERDLHDGAQQQLVALALDVQAMQEGVPADLAELRADLRRVGRTLISTLEELREIARGIHPAILAEGGLGPALKTLARRSPIPVELDLDFPSRLAEPVEVAAYYVVAESLANAAKHADASLITITGNVRDGVLRVVVQDDGRGGATPTAGSGLVGIVDRVEALGGTLVIRSPAGAGTAVELALPAQPADRPAHIDASQ